MIERIETKLKNQESLVKEDIFFLLESADDAFLLKNADRIRKEQMGDEVHLRGLFEFSNICKRNCNYCGLRYDNKHQHRYRITPDDVVEQALIIASYNVKTVVMQSGEDGFYTIDILTDIIRRIKQNADIAITLSIGEKTKDEYRALFEAGADRYLLRHETASKRLYEKLHPDSLFEDRIRCIEDLFDIGFQVGMGCMVGVPYQTVDDMVEDIMFLQKYQPDMVGIGPYISGSDTPFRDFKSGTIENTLKMVALARIVCPQAHLPATTAIGTIDEFGREKALRVGANVVMPNFTPQEYKIHYNIYPNKRCIDEQASKCNNCIRGMILREGRIVGTGYGHSLKYDRKKG